MLKRNLESKSYNQIDLVFRNEASFPDFDRDYCLDILNSILLSTEITDGAYALSLNFVNEEEIRALNQKYRNINKSTDVLSFPLDSVKINKEARELGDIFICPQYIKDNSATNDLLFDQEIVRAIVHGFLHLIGYDHEKSEHDEEIMLGLQEKIVSQIINEKPDYNRN